MTNEEYINAINLRCSRRTYESKFIDEGSAEAIKNMTELVNKRASLNFIFIENASPAFTVFSGKFSAVAVCAEDSEKARIQCGYYGELIVLECVSHGLGTCWVTGTYDENKVVKMVNIPKNSKLYGLIVIGKAKPRLSVKEKLMYNVTHKQNKTYQKMFDFCDDKLPEHFEYAMKMVEKAPSAVNRRPVHFKYENGKISAFVDEPYSDKSIDFGIAQLHFQLGARAKGVRGEWDFAGRFCVGGDAESADGKGDKK